MKLADVKIKKIGSLFIATMGINQIWSEDYNELMMLTDDWINGDGSKWMNVASLRYNWGPLEKVK